MTPVPVQKQNPANPPLRAGVVVEPGLPLGPMGFPHPSLFNRRKARSHGHFFGVHESSATSYVDLSSTIPLRNSGYKILAHFGHQNYPRRANSGYWGGSGGDNSFFSYRDYKLGVTKDIEGFVLGVAWTYADTKHAAPDGETTAYMNAFGKNIGRDRITLTLTRNF